MSNLFAFTILELRDTIGESLSESFSGKVYDAVYAKVCGDIEDFASNHEVKLTVTEGQLESEINCRKSYGECHVTLYTTGSEEVDK